MRAALGRSAQGAGATAGLADVVQRVVAGTESVTSLTRVPTRPGDLAEEGSLRSIRRASWSVTEMVIGSLTGSGLTGRSPSRRVAGRQVVARARAEAHGGEERHELVQLGSAERADAAVDRAGLDMDPAVEAEHDVVVEAGDPAGAAQGQRERRAVGGERASSPPPPTRGRAGVDDVAVEEVGSVPSPGEAAPQPPRRVLRWPTPRPGVRAPCEPWCSLPEGGACRTRSDQGMTGG